MANVRVQIQKIHVQKYIYIYMVGRYRNRMSIVQGKITSNFDSTRYLSFRGSNRDSVRSHSSQTDRQSVAVSVNSPRFSGGLLQSSAFLQQNEIQRQ